MMDQYIETAKSLLPHRAWYGNDGDEYDRQVGRIAAALRAASEAAPVLRAELELERMRLAACGVAALANTPTTVAQRISRDHPYWSASYGDVCAAVDREMAYRDSAPASLRKLLEECRAALMFRRQRHLSPDDGTAEFAQFIARLEAALAAPVVSAWTSEPPKVEGDWWWRDLSTGRKHRMVYVFADQTVTGDPRVDYFTGDQRTLQQQIVTVSEIGGEWQGPLEPK